MNEATISANPRSLTPEERERRLGHLRQLADVLFNPDESIERLRAACADLEEILSGLHAVPTANIAEDQRFRHNSKHGEVISPGYAISTMQDAIRTSKFARALVQAIETMRAGRPGERIHILYPGPGPNAPFFLLATTRFSPAEIGFCMIEYMEQSFDAARHLVDVFGLGDYVIDFLQGDAVEYRHKGPEIHVLIAEIMQQALRGEPQFAVFKNLVPQLAEDSILIPHEIELRAGLSDPRLEFKGVKTYPLAAEGVALRHDLGSLLTLSKETLMQRYRREPKRYARTPDWDVPNFKIPPMLTSARMFTIFTKIRLAENIELLEGESGLTMPVYERTVPAVQRGDEIRCKFVLGEKPGLFAELHRPRMRIIQD
jgi:hypothetical protein